MENIAVIIEELKTNLGTANVSDPDRVIGLWTHGVNLLTQAPESIVYIISNRIRDNIYLKRTDDSGTKSQMLLYATFDGDHRSWLNRLKQDVFPWMSRENLL